jgi:hypothetical protein
MFLSVNMTDVLGIMSEKLGLSPREQYRLRLFENRVLRRIFGPKRESGRRMERTT